MTRTSTNTTCPSYPPDAPTATWGHRNATTFTETGAAFGSQNPRQAHSHQTAYAAVKAGNPALAIRAWQECYDGHAGYPRNQNWAGTRVEGRPCSSRSTRPGSPPTPQPSTGLAAIQCLALIGDKLPG
ncbi:exo-rhamnogalacturonan lyase family protein [Actinoplanes flavus]|uniref:PcRGLX/YetA-like C-terminal alpha/alpha toroid domain-containing protein n=1 Tax=Actinoplanes flavus TaxID=2820290 RepID=A0ABS3ULG6_9ACTN|nr:hypothetical protein [Actinoplanes flavus]MBO3739630.1 hypothetical protein [Actinoplanes flavus]